MEIESHILSIYFICATFYFKAALSQNVTVPRALLEGTDPANPGLILLLNQAAFDLLNDVGIQEMNERLSKLDIESDAKSTSNFELLKVKVTSYKAPYHSKLTLIPPNRLQWTMEGMDLSMIFTGKLNFSLLGFGDLSGVGEFEVAAQNITGKLDILIKTTENGEKVYLQNTECKSNVPITKLVANGNGSIIRIMQMFGNMAKTQVQKQFEKDTCSRSRAMIEEGFGEKLAVLNMKAPLFNQLFFDNTLRSPPLITEHYMLQLQTKGEVSWKGNGNTPFGPGHVQITKEHSKEMFHLFVSDFVLNSLLYHAQAHNLLDINVNGKSFPILSSLLQVNCDKEEDALCLGQLIPDLKTQFPEHMIEIRLRSLQMPYIEFETDLIRLHMNAYFGLYMINPKQESDPPQLAMINSVNITAEGRDLRIDSKNGRIFGRLDLKDFDLKVEASYIGGMSTDQIKEMIFVGKTIIDESVNDYLNGGIQIPKFKSFENLNIQVSMRPHTLQVHCNLLPEAAIEGVKLISANVFRNFER